MSTATETHVKYAADLANHFGGSERNAASWSRKKTFPKKGPKGWKLAEVDAWLRSEGYGPYYEKAVTAEATKDLRAAKIIAETEGIQLNNRKKALDLEKEQGSILDAEEVARLFERVALTQNSLLDQWPDMVLKELPDKPPKVAQWKAHKKRMEKTAKRMADDLRNIMQALLTGRDKEVQEILGKWKREIGKG